MEALRREGIRRGSNSDKMLAVSVLPRCLAFGDFVMCSGIGEIATGIIFTQVEVQEDPFKIPLIRFFQQRVVLDEVEGCWRRDS